MINKSCSTVGWSTKLAEAVLPETSRRLEEHEDWRLDEALAETFPASDPIAISSDNLLHTSLPQKSLEAGGANRISDCRIGSGNDLKSTALETPFDCEYCHAKIPSSVAISFDGTDYIYHFCGPRCIEAWCMKLNLL